MSPPRAVSSNVVIARIRSRPNTYLGRARGVKAHHEHASPLVDFMRDTSASPTFASVPRVSVYMTTRRHLVHDYAEQSGIIFEERTFLCGTRQPSRDIFRVAGNSSSSTRCNSAPPKPLESPFYWCGSRCLTGGRLLRAESVECWWGAPPSRDDVKSRARSLLSFANFGSSSTARHSSNWSRAR
jgi:hypothetical protein